MEAIGKYIFVIGIFLVFAGLVLWLFGDKVGWLGNLPGDIRIKKENYSVYIPVTTMILISIALSVIVWLIRKLFH
jgi:hypothetical protein